jgi:hypothetical protein
MAVWPSKEERKREEWMWKGGHEFRANTSFSLSFRVATYFGFISCVLLNNNKPIHFPYLSNVRAQLKKYFIKTVCIQPLSGNPFTYCYARMSSSDRDEKISESQLASDLSSGGSVRRKQSNLDGKHAHPIWSTHFWINDRAYFIKRRHSETSNADNMVECDRRLIHLNFLSYSRQLFTH